MYFVARNYRLGGAQIMLRRINLVLALSLLFLAVLVVPCGSAYANDRLFTYSYDTKVAAADETEFEQWATLKSGHEHGDYVNWEFRSELEYGFSDKLQGSLYLNLEHTREALPGESESEEFEFKSFSAEGIYQITHPRTDVIGTALYLEVASDGLDYSLEPKLLISKDIDNWEFVFNAIYEAEWTREDNQTLKEAELQFTSGLAYQFNRQWAAGFELRNLRDYPDGLDLGGEEFFAWFLGPVVHYQQRAWWITATILPQIFGNGDGSEGNRQLVHAEAIEARVIFGYEF